MVFGAIRPPGGPLRFDAAESDDGGAEVLAESLIFAAPTARSSGRNCRRFAEVKASPKTRVHVRRLAFGDVRRFSYNSYRSHKCYPLLHLEAVPVDRSPRPNAFFPLGTAAKKWQKYLPLDHDRLDRFQTTRPISAPFADHRLVGTRSLH
jgi:hypothetical protein